MLALQAIWQDDQVLLPDSLISTFQAFANNPNASVMELHRAIEATSLATTYQKIRKGLGGAASEQSLGGDFMPDDTDDDVSQELENLARDLRVPTHKLETTLAKVNRNLENANQILAAENPVQAIHQLNEASRSE